MQNSIAGEGKPSSVAKDVRRARTLVREQITAARLAWGSIFEGRDALAAYEDTLRRELSHAAALSELSIKFFGRRPD